jgi:hypothetical protein
MKKTKDERIAYEKGLTGNETPSHYEDPKLRAAYEEGKEERAGRKLRPSVRF